MGKNKKTDISRARSDYLSEQVENSAKEISRLDRYNLILHRENKRVLTAFNYIKILQEKTQEALTVKDLYHNIVNTITSDLKMDSAVLLSVDLKNRRFSIIASSGLKYDKKEIIFDENISENDILSPAYASKSSNIRPFHNFIIKSFDFPYFIWHPFSDEKKGSFAIFAGNIGEDMLTRLPFSEESLTTFGAITSAIILRKDNILKTMELIKSKEERISFLAEILKNSPISIIAADKNGKITYVNRATEKLYGYKMKELIGKDPGIFNAEPDSDRIQKEILATVKKGNVWKGEILNIKKNREQLYISASVYQLSDENGKLLALVGFQEDITERKNTEKHIKKSLQEKEVLLKEIHHRVKNNLQIVSSLLNIQSKFIKDKKAIEIYNDSRNRIKTMALIHERLYKSEDFSRIDIAEYVETLTSFLYQTYNITTRIIKVNLDIKDTILKIEYANPVGLIINELISNSLKYAFPKNRKGEISISLTMEENNKYTLLISDNGIGLPEYLDFRKTQTFGLQLVNILVNQLKGDIELDTSSGTKFRITFQGD